MKTLIVLIIGLLAATGARAQSPTSRGYLSIGGDVAVAPATFSDTVHPIEFGEASTITSAYQPKLAPGIEVGGGARVWRGLTVGAAVSWVTRADSATVDAQVPHPFFFGKPRAVSGSTSGLNRDETSIHLQALWHAAAGRRWVVAFGGGPSWIAASQDVVQDIAVTQTYPFDSATFASATTTHVSKSRLGYNVAADAAYMVRPHVGVGFGATFSHASIPISSTTSIDAGGGHINGGLRLVF